MKEGAPFLGEGVCIYCGDEIGSFSITPLMESEDGESFHQMCEDCADEHFRWEIDDEEDEVDD